MAVGAGSIKRASKLNTEAVETVTKETAENAATPVAKKRRGRPRKATAQMPSGNEVCHLTEELPIHLL